ncbi:Lrp/AsnC family transcriptional regulator [Tanticharoenia sakaeratensis]|uniref:Transcriptional regulator n=1 Tax=Tanticharoenia sakaeratensis NBRC 103193 TaxID=1231623 RepID=A0A0D6MK22_9PROT|nr:Lrp/AsnC family transcriptional regulator [Tanticharoenia sakaeratensis]GAN53982.1 transcriptional regulator [Tanticharoenia sakaeratensis NBRC 103193]GBQ23027.1 transcriptional regulator [Tanticharoenia sakaeratensis NBRC 103193]
MANDATDKALLDLLRRNARMPTATLARRLGLSRSTIQGRIDRLERQGLIGGYTIVETRNADAVRAQVMVTLTPRHAKSVERALRQIDAVRELHAVTGPADMIAMLGADSPEALDDAIDAIGTIPGVERTHSAMILSTKLQRA